MTLSCPFHFQVKIKILRANVESYISQENLQKTYCRAEVSSILMKFFLILAITGLTKTSGVNSETNSRPASPPSNGTPTHIPKGNNR